jgi:hypothetical protein
MAVDPLAVSPDIAAQFGVPSSAPNPLAQQAALANAVAAAPNIPVGGNPDPTIPAGVPAYGTPVAPYVPDPAAQQLAAQQALPTIPTAVPGAPLPGPPRGGGAPAAPDQMAGATGEVQAAGQEQTDVARQSVDIAKEQADVTAQQDQVRAQEAEASANRLTALQRQQETAYKESKGAFDQAKQDVSNFKFHDFFASQSNARMALSAIGMLLGGASYDEHHVNQAVAQVNMAMERDSKQQLDYLHSKEHLAELAQQGVRDTQSYLAHEMANFQTAEALKKEAVARQIDTLSSTTRGKQNIVAAQQVAAGLRAAAAKDAQAAILQGTHNRVMQSQIRLNDANAAHARAAAGAAGAGKKDAEELKVAGAIDRRLKSDPTTNTIIKSLDSLTEAKAAVATGNPVAIQGAIDSYIRSQTGLGARPGSIKMFTDRLGGAMEQLNAHLEQWKTGGIPPAMVKRFSAAVDDAFAQRSSEAKKMAGLHEKLLLKSPEYARHPELVKAHIADAFHQGGEEMAAATAGPPPGAIMGKMNGKRGYVVNGQFTALE